MNISELECIVEIAKCGSLTKAANRLFIQQPTLSKIVLRIEEELKTPLFQRTGRQLVLTPAGEYFVNQSKQILSIYNEIGYGIENIISSNSSIIRMGIPNSRGNYVISSVIPEFRKIYPNVRIVIDLNNTSSLIKKLEDGNLDIILINYHFEKLNLDYECVGEDEMVLVVPSGHRLIKLAKHRDGFRFPFIETADWAEEPFIIAGEMLHSGRYCSLFFERNHISPPIVLEIRNISQIMLAVKNGLGISIVPSIPENNLEPSSGLVYLSIDDHSSSVKIAAVTMQSKIKSEELKTLINIIKNKYP